MRYLFSILVAFFLLATTSSSFSQQTVPSQSRVLVAPAAQKIPVLKVRASNARSPRRSGGQTALDIAAKDYKAEKKPPKLGANEYQSLTNTGGRSSSAAGTTVQSNQKPTLQHLRLTPRKHYNSLGFLSFHQAQYVNPKLNRVDYVAVQSPEFAFVHAQVKAEKGERYLVDFTVSTTLPMTTFTMAVDGASQDFGVGPGNHHLLAFLEPAEDGDTSVAIWADMSVYKFYALDITRVQ
jgi:hypothetical protein